MTFWYLVAVETDTQEHADKVVYERTGFDEELVDDSGEEIVYRIWSEGPAKPLDQIEIQWKEKTT